MNNDPNQQQPLLENSADDSIREDSSQGGGNSQKAYSLNTGLIGGGA